MFFFPPPPFQDVQLTSRLLPPSFLPLSLMLPSESSTPSANSMQKSRRTIKKSIFFRSLRRPFYLCWRWRWTVDLKTTLCLLICARYIPHISCNIVQYIPGSVSKKPDIAQLHSTTYSFGSVLPNYCTILIKIRKYFFMLSFFWIILCLARRVLLWHQIFLLFPPPPPPLPPPPPPPPLERFPLSMKHIGSKPPPSDYVFFVYSGGCGNNGTSTIRTWSNVMLSSREDAKISLDFERRGFFCYIFVIFEMYCEGPRHIRVFFLTTSYDTVVWRMFDLQICSSPPGTIFNIFFVVALLSVINHQFISSLIYDKCFRVLKLN